jgi:hypothetical protein
MSTRCHTTAIERANAHKTEKKRLTAGVTIAHELIQRKEGTVCGTTPNLAAGCVPRPFVSFIFLFLTLNSITIAPERGGLRTSWIELGTCSPSPSLPLIAQFPAPFRPSPYSHSSHTFLCWAPNPRYASTYLILFLLSIVLQRPQQRAHRTARMNPMLRNDDGCSV